MKSLQEYIIDDKFENYLFDNLKTFLIYNDLYSGIIEESLELFANYQTILDIILNDIKKLHKNFEEKQIKISINSSQDYPKNVYINLFHRKEGISGAFNKALKNGDVYIDLNLGENFRIKWNRIKIMILHELMHGYHEFVRISNNQPSIFDEYTKEYKIATKNLHKQSNYLIRYFAFLKYFFNKEEIESYLATLELLFIQIIDKIKPSFEDLKFDNIKKLIKEEDVWRTYFSFGKFVLNIDNIDDKELEQSYAEICETIEDKDKRIKDRIEYLKKLSKGEITIEPSKDKISPKSAEEIRKECKDAWKDFEREFNSVFLEVFNENIRLSNINKFV
ncbi:MAG: hypothetical protein J1F35_06735 [Erysipelotrichales bacterium]|nr:hypothetical protein [Erysipelotrichales bacterium]